VKSPPCGVAAASEERVGRAGGRKDVAQQETVRGGGETRKFGRGQFDACKKRWVGSGHTLITGSCMLTECILFAVPKCHEHILLSGFGGCRVDVVALCAATAAAGAAGAAYILSLKRLAELLSEAVEFAQQPLVSNVNDAKSAARHIH